MRIKLSLFLIFAILHIFMVLKCDADQISYSHCHSSNQKWLDSLHCKDEETRKVGPTDMRLKYQSISRFLR
jgi:hypothetical protein